MYICICNGISSKKIEEAINEGFHSVEQLTMNTGAGNCCGSCVPIMEQMIEDHHAKNTGVMNVAPVEIIDAPVAPVIELPMLGAQTLKEKRPCVDVSLPIAAFASR